MSYLSIILKLGVVLVLVITMALASCSYTKSYVNADISKLSPTQRRQRANQLWKADFSDIRQYCFRSTMKPEVCVDVDFIGFDVKIIDWRDAPGNDHIGVLIFNPGQTGDKYIYSKKMIALIDKSSGKFLGEAPLSLVFIGIRGAKPAPGVVKVYEWEWGKNNVFVADPEKGIILDIELR